MMASLSENASVSLYQYGKAVEDLNEARVDGVLGWLQHQLDHIRTMCTSQSQYLRNG